MVTSTRAVASARVHEPSSWIKRGTALTGSSEPPAYAEDHEPLFTGHDGAADLAHASLFRGRGVRRG